MYPGTPLPHRICTCYGPKDVCPADQAWQDGHAQEQALTTPDMPLSMSAGMRALLSVMRPGVWYTAGQLLRARPGLAHQNLNYQLDRLRHLRRVQRRGSSRHFQYAICPEKEEGRT